MPTDPFATDKLDVHKNDLDASWDSYHHTLGKGPTQAALGNHKHDDLYVRLDVPPRFGAFNRTTDLPLTADVQNNIAFENESTQPLGTNPAVTMSTAGGLTTFSVLETGVYTVRWELDLFNSTLSTEKSFLVTGNYSGGNWSQTAGIKQITTGWGHRLLPLVVQRRFQENDTFYFTIRPVGSTATGWSVTWSGLTVSQLFGVLNAGT